MWGRAGTSGGRFERRRALKARADHMGDSTRKLSATGRFIQRFPYCCFCSGQRPAATREHMPPKALFDRSHRPDDLVMPACEACNSGTSTADLVASIVSRWAHNSTTQENLDHARLAARVRKQAPELISEWTKFGPGARERGRLHLTRHGVQVPEDAGLVAIGPLTIRQLNLFAHKLVLALYFHIHQKALLDTGLCCAMWVSKEDLARGGIPEFVLQMLPRYGTLIQGRWDERETFEFRHQSNDGEGLFGCLARLRRRFFVMGFAVVDGSVLPSTETDWLKPSALLSAVESPRFQKRF
jgi:hypothetical protein